MEANLARAGSNKGAFTFTPVNCDLRVTVGDTTSVHKAGEADFHGGDGGVFHLQAPTSQSSRPHPAASTRRRRDPVRVWHNGILQPSAIEEMQTATGCASDWDTQLIASALACGFISPEFSKLWEVEGAWACIAEYEGHLFAFRNPVAPLFTDGTSLSSVKTGEICTPLIPGCVYQLVCTAEGPVWAQTSLKYDCKHNPYGL